MGRRSSNDLTRLLSHWNHQKKMRSLMKKYIKNCSEAYEPTQRNCSPKNIRLHKLFPEKNKWEVEEEEEEKKREKKSLNKGKNVHMATVAIPGNAHTHIQSRLISRNVVNSDGFYQKTVLWLLLIWIDCKMYVCVCMFALSLNRKLHLPFCLVCHMLCSVCFPPDLVCFWTPDACMCVLNMMVPLCVMHLCRAC